MAIRPTDTFSLPAQTDSLPQFEHLSDALVSVTQGGVSPRSYVEIRIDPARIPDWETINHHPHWRVREYAGAEYTTLNELEFACGLFPGLEGMGFLCREEVLDGRAVKVFRIPTGENLNASAEFMASPCKFQEIEGKFYAYDLAYEAAIRGIFLLSNQGLTVHDRMDHGLGELIRSRSLYGRVAPWVFKCKDLADYMSRRGIGLEITGYFTHVMFEFTESVTATSWGNFLKWQAKEGDVRTPEETFKRWSKHELENFFEKIEASFTVGRSQPWLEKPLQEAKENYEREFGPFPDIDLAGLRADVDLFVEEVWQNFQKLLRHSESLMVQGVPNR